ncbi:hypothetical protein SRHO_G00233520 [Serrasalmus rhombeus]
MIDLDLLEIVHDLNMAQCHVLHEPGVAHAVLQWCRNPGGGRQHTEGVSTAEEAIKTLVHLYLASWRELQSVFQDAEKHWKQLEEQQVATLQMVRSLQPSVCVGAGAPFSPLLKPPVLAPRRTGAFIPPPLPAACHLSPPVPTQRRFRAPLLPTHRCSRELGTRFLSPPLTASEDLAESMGPWLPF